MKKNVISRFKIVRHGYDKESVDAFIANSERINRDSSSDKNMRIEELKAQVEELKSELAQYKEREGSVTDALTAAIERAKELDNAAKIRYALEGERIRLFRDKWERYCDAHKTKLGIRERREKVSDFLYVEEQNLIAAMQDGFKIEEEPERVKDVEQQYIDESKRLLELVKNETAADEFNLEDLNSEHDLKALCNAISKKVS